MTEETTLQRLGEQAGTAPCESEKKSLCLWVNRGILKTAKLTGKAIRACREGVGATGSLLTKPFRGHKLPLPIRASKAIHQAQVRVGRGEKEIAKLTSRLAECLAQNVGVGSADPADEPNTREIARAIEAARAREGEVRGLIESVEKTVTLLEERLASLAESGEEDTPNLSVSAPEARPASSRQLRGPLFPTPRHPRKTASAEPKELPVEEGSAEVIENDPGAQDEATRKGTTL